MPDEIDLLQANRDLENEAYVKKSSARRGQNAGG